MGSRRKSPQELVELWKGEVTSLLTVSKMGVEYRQVERELEEMSGERIPVHEMGFNSIGDFLYAIRDVHQVCVLYGEDPSSSRTRLFLFIREDAVNEDTKNVLRLVQGQDKGKIKKRRDGTVSKPSRTQVRTCSYEYLKSRRSYSSTAPTPLMNGFFSSRPLPSSRGGGSNGRTNFFQQRLQQEQEQRRLRDQQEQRRLREEIEQKRKEQEQRRLREEIEQKRKEQELKRIREEIEQERLEEQEKRRIREELEQERLKEKRRLREELEHKRLKEQERLREEAERIKNDREKEEIMTKQEKEKISNGIGEDVTDYRAVHSEESQESIEFSKTHPGMARIRSIRTLKLRNLARQMPTAELHQTSTAETENDLSYTIPTSIPHVYPPPCKTRPVERVERINLEPDAELHDGVNLQPHRVNRPRPVIGSQFLDGVLQRIAGMHITRPTEGTSPPEFDSPHKILRTSMYD